MTIFQRLVFFCLTAAALTAAADQSVVERVGKNALEYARQLAERNTVDYSGQERRLLFGAARLMAEKGQCGDAVQVGRQGLSGLAAPDSDQWRQLAAAAYCAKRWNDAVNAAFLAYRGADSDALRAKALLLVGQSMEAHWQYGAKEALWAYQTALGYQKEPLTQASVQRLKRLVDQESALRLERLYVQADGALPAVCLDFNTSLPATGEQNYADYVRFEPAFEAVFHKPASDEICAEGAEFGATYSVTLLAGLRASNDGKLSDSLRRQVRVDDRPPKLWFANSRYVLPRGGGVPVHAVNVDKAELTLYRVGERNLLNQDIRRLFRTDIGRYQSRRIRDELGEQLWQGEADLVSRSNKEAVTRLPIAELAQPAPGVYVLTARPLSDQNDRQDAHQQSAQWLVVSDIGIASYRGDDGLTVVTRSLATADVLSGVRLALFSRNNRLLGEMRTDENGVARFPRRMLLGGGGREPLQITASSDSGDFNFLDISGSPYDLSDRGVAGREAPGPLDAFLYTERGVYRPGERVNLVVVLRNQLGAAVDGLPLTLRLLRPDQQLSTERLAHPQGAGGYALELPLSSSARTGRWTVQAYLDKDADPIGSSAFLVEAIVPPRIEVDVSNPPAGPLKPDTEGRFGVVARYLFGAPAADLAARAEVRIEPDPNPYPQFPGYRFGPVDDTGDGVLLPLQAMRTGTDGKTEFAYRIDRLPKSKRPLRAKFRAEVIDVDGRAVAATHAVPLFRQARVIGIKAPEGGAVQEGSEALFEVLSLASDGRVQAAEALAFRLIEEDINYQWYQDRGRWRYKRQVRDKLIREGQLNTTNDAPGRIAMALYYGRYRLEVSDKTNGVLSSVRISVGWQGGGPDSETPDMLTLRADSKAYRPGDVAKLRLQAPFTGLADLVIATDKVLSVRSLHLNERETVLEVPIDEAWGAGAYALVSAYRPDGGSSGHGPRRAVGVAWLGLDKSLKRLDIDIAAPEKTQPRQTFDVPVRISGQKPGEAVYLTLAAVDEGVLNLTDYRTPNPLQHYFGQRRLAVGLRDLYGRLIDGHKGAEGRIRSGGGASGKRGMPDSHVRIVSLFSGIVRPDAGGAARIPLTLPDFNGRLRLTAVAWSRDKVGSAENGLTVRDPVVMMPSLPRFLAAGDNSRASVLLNNVEGPPGEYRLTWRTSGAVGLDSGAAETLLQLDSAQQHLVEIPLRGESVGNGMLRLALHFPDGTQLRRDIRIGVRAPYLPEYARRLGRLPAGGTAVIGPDEVRGLRPETVSASLSVSARPDLDVPGLLRRLDLYPYGCLEQVTSRAFPLLHLQRLSDLWGYAHKTPADALMQDAVARILDKQLSNGAFALWRAGGDEEAWLSAHALDFLGRARTAGFEVPDFAWEKGLGWLRRQVAYPDADNPNVTAVQTYALYLLARNGEAYPETARYLWDQGGKRLPSALSAAQLGAALSIMGSSERAAEAFSAAKTIQRHDKLRDYGSPLRDKAALVQLLAEYQGDTTGLADLVQQLAEDMGGRRWLSTQEQAWLVRAASALGGSSDPLVVTLADIPMPEQHKPLTLQLSVDTLSSGLSVGNAGVSELWYSLALEGSPTASPPVRKEGFHIERNLFNLSGKTLNEKEIYQGEMMVVVLEGRVGTQGVDHQALVVDPLPAGIEAESASLANARSTMDLDWLKRLSPTRYTEALDDRFVAALDLPAGKATFRIAYLARAVTPGHYQAPGPQVEDMYKPRYRGRGEAGELIVLAAGDR